MKKWTLAILFVLIFALVACGNDDTANKDAGKDDETEDVVDEGEDAGEEELGATVDYEQTPEMDFDLGGRTLELVSWYDESLGEGSPDAIAIYENMEALKEKHNFDVEYVIIDYSEIQENVTDSLNDLAEYDIGFLPFPKGPNADDYRGFNSGVHGYAIPKVVDNPEQLIYIWEKIYDVESVYDYHGQASFESAFSNQDDIDNMRRLTTNIVAFDHFGFPNLDYYAIEHELIEGNAVSTIIETYAQTFQAAIDEVYGE